MSFARLTSRHRLFVLISVLGVLSSVSLAAAQTIWVPGGTATGISNNTTNSNVGIGTASPGFNLEVSKDDSGGSVDLLVKNLNSTAGSQARIMSYVTGDSSGNPQLGVGITGIRDYYWYIDNADGNKLKLNSNGGSPFMSIDNAGNMGIGTTSPAAKLEISGINSSGHDAELIIRTLGAAYNNPKLSLYSGYPADRNWQITTAVAQLGDFVICQSTTAGGDPYGGNARFYISSSGNVGIGTTSPGSYKLAVNGTIRAKEVIVDTGWADYVFAEDYRLAPLAEVESHIKAKKHLPGIPSAAEVAEHGVSMGDMQSKLLSKIEEVTLHLIAQEKAILALQRENAELRKQVEARP